MKVDPERGERDVQYREENETYSTINMKEDCLAAASSPAVSRDVVRGPAGNLRLHRSRQQLRFVSPVPGRSG